MVYQISKYGDLEVLSASEFLQESRTTLFLHLNPGAYIVVPVSGTPKLNAS